ncbi:MAG: hypothetical protein ACYC4K_02850 [Thiobacillus sp.]
MTIIPFTPSNKALPPFVASFTLDGQNYTGVGTWNFAVQRWYFTLTDSYGNIAWNGALVGSPLDYNIYLALGIFQTSTILFREDTGNFEVNP